MNTTLGSRIAMRRREKGLTQEGLAEKLGVSSQAVSKWENDLSCPDISLLPKLAQVLGLTTDELLTGNTGEVKLLPVNERKSLDELTLRVKVNSAEGDKVRINLPMSLVKVTLELGIDIGPSFAGNANMEALKNVDLQKIMDMVERGVIGKLVEIESADGDTVEVVVE